MFRGAPSFASDNLHVWADLQSWLSGETPKSQHDIASRHLTCLDSFAYVRVRLRQDECRNKASHVVQEMSSDSGTVLSREELMEALCVATWGGLTKSQLVSKRQEQWGENMGKLDAPIQLYLTSSSTSSLLYPFVSTVSLYNKLFPEHPIIVLCCDGITLSGVQNVAFQITNLKTDLVLSTFWKSLNAWNSSHMLTWFVCTKAVVLHMRTVYRRRP